MNPSTQRITALDYARAWAIFGMIIVNYTLAMQAEQEGTTWLRVVSGMLQGRASALFVILAGIGVSLMTAKARKSMDRAMLRQQRMSLYRRSVFLFGAGLLLLLMGWNADILHYYAVFMLVAAALFHISDRKLLGLAAVILLVSQWGLIQFDYSEGWDSSFHVYNGFWTVEGFIRNLVFNGFHPIFPWVCFFLIGMWMGRKRGLLAKENRQKLLFYSLLGTVVLETLSYYLIQFSSSVLDTDSAHYLFSTKPMPPTLLYVLSATSSAVAIIAISLYIVHALGNAALTQAMIHTGQLSLSHYIGHIVIGLGILEMVDYLENGSLAFAVAYGCAYFMLAILFSYVWRKIMPRGPIELIMRKVC
ncbi:hypothetical protein BVG16_25765 [Paenibacillus selenitireducens]|uniref:Heparan-alpha-glucosaminide N-acetyltransferase catalytic domain-containing protein n=1 Tax=Paenibacillus selenitireducens TaxID=1324314 RepID=A0A1T2X2R0_9BACL|nr:heparan-alpha-glucosaminide N-acetyltransferase domain-containing protein [Paenibacillus selenitireducens]OPA74154.1 hypothetical protein BVG16_25765 [Paenibacillus selenitireducens]